MAGGGVDGDEGDRRGGGGRVDVLWTSVHDVEWLGLNTNRVIVDSTRFGARRTDRRTDKLGTEGGR